MININNIYVFIRKSSDLSDYSIATQENSINNYIRNELNLNPEQISHKFCTVGSAFQNDKTHKDILSFIKQKKNIYLIVFDVSRLSRNHEFFETILLPRFKKNNVTVCVTINQSDESDEGDENNQKQFKMSNDDDINELQTMIQNCYRESKDKSNTSKRTSQAQKLLRLQRNEGLPIDQIYDVKLGRVRVVKDGYYRNLSSACECRLKEGWSIENGKLLIKEPSISETMSIEDLNDNIDNHDDFNEKEQLYKEDLNILISYLRTSHSDIETVYGLLKKLCLFPENHVIHNESNYTLKKILSAAKIKKNFGNIDYLPLCLVSMQINNIFNKYGIYYSTDLTPWSIKKLDQFDYTFRDVKIKNFDHQNGVFKLVNQVDQVDQLDQVNETFNEERQEDNFDEDTQSLNNYIYFEPDQSQQNEEDEEYHEDAQDVSQFVEENMFNLFSISENSSSSSCQSPQINSNEDNEDNENSSLIKRKNNFPEEINEEINEENKYFIRNSTLRNTVANHNYESNSFRNQNILRLGRRAPLRSKKSKSSKED